MRKFKLVVWGEQSIEGTMGSRIVSAERWGPHHMQGPDWSLLGKKIKMPGIVDLYWISEAAGCGRPGFLQFVVLSGQTNAFSCTKTL